MPAPTTPTLAVMQGGSPVTEGETVLLGTVLLVSLTGSTIPSATPPPTAGLAWSDAANGAIPAPAAGLTWSDATTGTPAPTSSLTWSDS